MDPMGLRALNAIASASLPLFHFRSRAPHLIRRRPFFSVQNKPNSCHFPLSHSSLCSSSKACRGNALPYGFGGAASKNPTTKEFLQVVLVSPQIPGNTGCIARTCAASAVKLHLVGPLGFQVDDAKLKRAGLDYWPYVVVKVHSLWSEFREYFTIQEGEKRLLAFTKGGTNIHSENIFEAGTH